jgi:hypothetical protein
MTAPLLIGLAGFKRSGKSTVANWLVDADGFLAESFAGPIRHVVAELLGMDPATLERDKESPVEWLDGLTPRHLMQTLGTEWGRAQHPELWVRSLFQRIAAREARAGRRLNWVIHDVRFPNEAQSIRDRGGYIVRVTRLADVVADRHASEIPLPVDLVDYVIPNTGSLVDLFDATGALVHRLRQLRAA